MKFAQRKIRLLTRLMLVAVFFAQGTLAAHGCVMPANSAEMVHNTASATEDMPCHQAEKKNVNACLMHCEQTNQVNHDQQLITILPIKEVVMSVVQPQIQNKLIASIYTPLTLDTGPPLSIRFCSFLI